MTDESGGADEHVDSAGDKEVVARLEVIDSELAALLAERAAILANYDAASPIARLFTRTLVGYSSIPGANYVADPGTQADLVIDSGSETEGEVAARVDRIDTN